MACQTQQGSRAFRPDRLSEMGLIHQEHGAGRRQIPRQPGPAGQRNGETDGIRLLTPVAMKPDGRDHQNSHLHAADHGAGRQQSRQRLSQTHLIGQQGTPSRQQPAHTAALMPQRLTTIGQNLLKIGRRHQIPVGRHRRQRVTAPAQPLLQIRSDVKPLAELRLQGIRRSQWEFPARGGAMPMPPGTDPFQLRLCDRIEWTDDTDQTCGRQT
mgnify:CR=1 FL=1